MAAGDPDRSDERAGAAGGTAAATPPDPAGGAGPGPGPAGAAGDVASDLPRRSVRGGAVVLAGQVATVGLGLVSAAVLARLLTPEAYGLIAMAAAFIALVTTFAELGLAQATVQRSRITDEQVNALFWINAALGVGAASLGLVLARPIAWFYGEPALAPVVMGLSVAFVLTGISSQHRAVLQRRMRFATLTIVDVSSLAGAIALAIGAAALGAGHWALVLLAVSTAGLRAAGLWATSGWRPGRPARAEGLGSMIRFGAYLSGTSLFGTLMRNLDRILIGRFFGPAVAGYYFNAHRLLLMPVSQLNAPLSSVALPTLSRLQDDPERFRLFYRRGVEVVAAASFPAVLTCLIAADHLVPVVLGGQWADSIPIFKALAPAALLASVNVVTSWVYVPLGRTDRQFRWHVFRSCCVMIGFAIGLPWGALGLAIAFSTTACLLRIPAILYCFHGTFLRLGDVVDATWRVGAAAGMAAALAVPVAIRVGADAPHLPKLALIAATFGLAYLAAWVVVPGGLGRLSAMLATARHLRPGGPPAPPSEGGRA